MVDLNQVEKQLNNILAVQQLETTENEAYNQTATIPAQSDIELKSKLIEPENRDNLITRDLRTSNLRGLTKFQVLKGVFFGTWLDSFLTTYSLKNDLSVLKLQEELERDIAALTNVSVAEGGWITSSILSPVRKFSIIPEREKKFLQREK